MLDQLQKINAEAEEGLLKINSIEELNEFRTKILGRKGAITLMLRGLKDIKPEDRARTGDSVDL